MTPAAAKALLESLTRRVDAELASALDTVAETVAAEARRLLDGAGARPSQPGEPPADPSGVLADVITTGRAADGSAAVTAAAPYAAALEYGTTRMAARPFLRPAVANAEGTVRDILANALARAVAGAWDDTA